MFYKYEDIEKILEAGLISKKYQDGNVGPTMQKQKCNANINMKKELYGYNQLYWHSVFSTQVQ